MINNTALAMMSGPDKPPPGIPGAVKDENVYYKNALPADKDADLRDTLSLLLAQKPKDAGKYLSDIAFSIGATDKTGAIQDPGTYDTARTILDKVMLFNQRPDMVAASPKDRVTSFFDIHKDDKSIGNIITRLKAMGSGVDANYNDSPLAGLGRFPLIGAGQGTQSGPDIGKQLVDRIEKKIAKK